jgi:2-isopropylmalate synthase
MTPEQVKHEAAAAVARAKGYLDDVEFSPEDGYRSDPDFMCEVCQIAVDNGATTLNIPDTVGFAVPEDYGKLIRYVIEHVKGDYIVSTHCHDDLGLAVANSLAGVANGARQVECAVNGLGERAGNAALEEIVMAIKTRSDYFAGTTVNVKTDELARTSRLVSRLTGYHVQYNKAVVGRNAFAHESGIHQHGVLSDRETYEIIDASSVGQEAAQIVLGKHSGRHAFADTLEKMGIHVQGDALNAAFVRFKELADKKIEITEADLEAIVAEELGAGIVHRFAIHEIELHGGTAARPTARVVLTHNDGKVEASGTGDGMIDAAIDAISQATGVHGKLGSFQVSSVTGGSDALGAVSVTVDADNRKVTGRGVATDVVEASARAYLNAVNKIVRLQARGDAERVEEVGP